MNGHFLVVNLKWVAGKHSRKHKQRTCRGPWRFLRRTLLTMSRKGMCRTRDRASKRSRLHAHTERTQGGPSVMHDGITLLVNSSPRPCLLRRRKSAECDLVGDENQSPQQATPSSRSCALPLQSNYACQVPRVQRLALLAVVPMGHYKKKSIKSVTKNQISDRSWSLNAFGYYLHKGRGAHRIKKNTLIPVNWGYFRPRRI